MLKTYFLARGVMPEMAINNWARVVTAVALITTILAGCGVTSNQRGGANGANGPISGLRLMVPNTPGGGYDITGRTAAKVMEDSKIADNIEVFNLAGAGGTVGLRRLVNEKGNSNLAMMMGLGVVGAVYTNKSEATLAETTPLARMIEEAGAVFVSKDSPYRTLGQLVQAWKANPGKVTLGGGSTAGGPDHLLSMQLAEAVGIDPKVVNYLSYDGGGELLPALLGDKVAFGASGYAEFLDQVRAGQLRVLAVATDQRVPVLPDAPTAREQGVNLTFANWRGFVAPPGISDADRGKWLGALDRLHRSDRWMRAIEQNGWIDAYLTGDGFARFMTEQDQQVAGVLSKLGLS
jgi:putative tricarboxylic transport membrane protein